MIEVVTGVTAVVTGMVEVIMAEEGAMEEAAMEEASEAAMGIVEEAYGQEIGRVRRAVSIISRIEICVTGVSTRSHKVKS